MKGPNKDVRSFCVHLFEELQLDGVLEELSHGTGAMVHKGFLIKCYWLPLKTREWTPTVTIKSNTIYILRLQYYFCVGPNSNVYVSVSPPSFRSVVYKMY